MKTLEKSLNVRRACALGLIPCLLASVPGFADYTTDYRNQQSVPNLQIGSDVNSAENPFIQPQSDAESGGGRDQTLQFGDVLFGTWRDDVQVGRLGTDVMVGGRGDDVMIGGLEHFNPLNRDRAFGGGGNDIFIWKPGDGSDLFNGGYGHDVIIFGLAGEIVDGSVDFSVIADQQVGELALDPTTVLPNVDVTGSPGFCEVLDESVAADAGQNLAELGLDHVVRFSIRGIRNSFEAGEQTDDNGLRVSLHLQSVEVLVCTNRDGTGIEVLDLTTTPPTPISLEEIRSQKLRDRLYNIVF